MRIHTLIPARGGSKRLKYKNIYPLKGKPLILWTIDAALGSKYINKNNLYISTEDQKIKNVCCDFQIIDRPHELSGDDVWTQPVVDHFTQYINAQDDDIIVLLQANSPQITSLVIDQCIDKLINNNLWQVHTTGEDLIHNGAVHVYRNFVSSHKGKISYNGFVVTNWLDIHTKNDIIELLKIL
jgi:CMP-N-acetylneuraminic acid synthetase